VARPEKPEPTETNDRIQTGPNDEADADGYRRTRRQNVREGTKPAAGKKAGGRAGDEAAKAAPPEGARGFIEQHWEGWLSQVLLMAILGVGILGYKLEWLREGTIGLVLVGGMLAVAIYGTAGPAYDLIENKTARTLFAVLAIVWAAAVGYPALRKAVPRKVLGETVLTTSSLNAKVSIAENATGPYDLTASGTLRPDAGQEKRVDYAIKVGGDGGQETELSGEFSVSMHQARVRRGSNLWSEQHNQVEHRLPGGLRGKELTISTESVDELLQSGLHISIHPQSMDPQWFLLAGVLVVLAMLYVEARVGDSKTKTHLVMASASTLIFSYWFQKNATASRLVPPALDALLLAAVTGGIGGTLVGAVVRRISGRDRLKPRNPDEAEDSAEAKGDEKAPAET
jgi:hypothetical protein